jgi:site-specific recombinase XerD
MTPAPAAGLPHRKLEEIFDACIQTLATSHQSYRAAVHHFLAYLQTDFPQVLQLSELRRDPHLLGWLRRLCDQDPPLSFSTRRIYLVLLRRLLHDLASAGQLLQPGLILPEDVPPPPRRSPQPQFLFPEIIDDRIQTLTTILRPRTRGRYRSVARHFLAYLQTDFPQLLQLSELRRDPHLLGWLRRLGEQDPPLSPGNRQNYPLKLWHLLQEVSSAGHPLPPGLILPEDFPVRPRFRSTKERRSRLSHLLFGEIFDVRVQTLATTLQPSSVGRYRCVARHFLSYLQTDFPQLHQLAELRRDPHLFGWFRHLCQKDPPLCNTTRQEYLLHLRRLLDDLASGGHALPPGLILTEDLPPRPQYLPRALSLEEDQRLQEELRRTNDLLSNALLLMRGTGIRIGECVDLAINCLRSIGPDQWAVQVPLGKLRTERLVPVDEDVRQIVDCILTLRAHAPASHLARSARFLLPRSGPSSTLYRNLRVALHQAAERAGCSDRTTPHRLRHTYATEMIRLDVSLPALMKLLGHKTIRMTLRYVQVRTETYNASSIAPAETRCSSIECRNFPSPVFHQRPPICQASASPLLLLDICWKCTGVSVRTRPRSANYSAWPSASALSLWNLTASPQPKNEKRLAGQGTRKEVFKKFSDPLVL